MPSLPDIIRQTIRDSGPMTVASFMAMALTHPQHGYYMKQDPFGTGGDFTTAPEISQMFGEMIGVFLADTWMKMGSPGKCHLVEIGPGRGTLMDDIWRATKNLPGFHDAAVVHLVEISPHLRDLQKKRLGRIETLTHHDDILSLPFDAPLLVVGNEFFDAIPFRQAVFQAGKWYERVVGLTDSGDFTFGLGPALEIPATARDGAIIEFSPAREGIAALIASRLKGQGGVALFIDYGHDEKQTPVGDTFQAVCNHQYMSVFDDIGNADLTSHVDFAGIRRAVQNDVTVHGAVGQGAFLKNLGIDLRLERLGATTDRLSAHARLTGDDQMGTLFKVMALCHDPRIDLAGFHP